MDGRERIGCEAQQGLSSGEGIPIGGSEHILRISYHIIAVGQVTTVLEVQLMGCSQLGCVR
jgi:hypothetical protein